VPGLADDGEIAVVADATGVPAEAKADRLTRRDAFQSSHDKCAGQALPTRLYLGVAVAAVFTTGRTGKL
jgi:hypothetical protein